MQLAHLYFDYTGTQFVHFSFRCKTQLTPDQVFGTQLATSFHFSIRNKLYKLLFVFARQDREQWLSNKESTQNFDKVSFLAEHPNDHAFLSQFIETQMFTNFIDNKFQSFWSKKESFLSIFDERIQELL